MEKEIRELFDYRIRLLRDQTAHKKTERVPIMANTQQWLYLDAGYSQLEAGRDYAKCEDSGRKFLSKYKVDLLYGADCVRNPTMIYDALGQSASWTVSEDGNNVNAIFEDEMMHADEYDEMIADYEKTVWEKCLMRTFPRLREFSLDQFVHAVQVTANHFATKSRITATLREEFGAADPTMVIMSGCGFVNDLFNTYRGIKGLSIDLRRQPEKVYELCAIRDEISNNAIIAQLEAMPEGMDMEQPWDMMAGSLAHTILSRKHFENLIFSNMKKVFSVAIAHGKQIHMNTEGSILRFADCFQEFPKGYLNCIIEMDDPFEIRKQIPNIAITGGLSVDIMGNGTPQECVDMAKRAIDGLAVDGGLWLSPNKFVTYDYDMKSENLSAVCDFVVDYRG